MPKYDFNKFPNKFDGGNTRGTKTFHENRLG